MKPRSSNKRSRTAREDEASTPSIVEIAPRPDGGKSKDDKDKGFELPHTAPAWDSGKQVGNKI